MVPLAAVLAVMAPALPMSAPEITWYVAPFQKFAGWGEYWLLSVHEVVVPLEQVETCDHICGVKDPPSLASKFAVS
jgi:hypothetical protein